MTTAWRKVATAAVIEIDWNWKTSSWEVKERQTKEGKIQLCKSISSRLWSRPEERSQVNAIGNDGDATKESHLITSFRVCVGVCVPNWKREKFCSFAYWIEGTVSALTRQKNPLHVQPTLGWWNLDVEVEKNLIKSCRCDNLASRFNYANTDTTHNDANESTSKPWNKTGLAGGWIINTIG